MKIRDRLKHMWRGIRRSGRLPGPRLPAAMRPLVEGLAHTQIEELSCDEVYALLDVFAESSSRGENVAALMPSVQHHLDMCADCREELVALLRSMEATAG